jgi:hypothetical protein
MYHISSRLFQQVALVMVTTALLPAARLGAQETLVATARMVSRPLTRPGADSGKFMVSVKISGIPEVGLRTLGPGQVVLVDGLGRTYTPSAFTVSVGATQPQTLLAAYMTPPADRLADRHYIFFVAPGLMTFEIRVAGLKSVRIVPTITPSLR